MEEGRNRFLHGTLEVTIFHATPDSSSSPLSCLFGNGKPTYVTIKINDEMVAKTRQKRDRIWNQTFHVLCAHPADATITITVKTNYFTLGSMRIPAEHILNEASLINGSFPLLEDNGGKGNPELKLQLLLWFKPAELELSWERTIRHGEHQGLSSATFPQRPSCNVRLYQDAHHTPAFRPPNSDTPTKLWEDVYKAMEGAQHLIYIAGWSFNPNTVLVRDPNTNIPYAKGVRLGELLKRKAEEGVAVKVLIWNDETSLPLIKNKGIMGTYDEEALAYFNHTKVICRLCPRVHTKFPTLFTHHQKTISVDAPSETCFSYREIMSFIGGLDLCGGRYDTEEHSLFKTLNTEPHFSDFHQINIAGANIRHGGPREPWHDVHACVTGDAAWDILTNFEQRWARQCNSSMLIPITIIPNLRPPGVPPNRNWNVQVFRSIDHLSAAHPSKSFVVEQSIHEAYVEAIRRADKFIYIENQYFIGGCHLWDKDGHAGCKNLIPVEIALKVASKIRAKERFCVYIVIPMWPEGVPESEAVQEILHWTRKTMSMMYGLIGDALKESQQAGHPRDYLNFFCLANREEKGEGEYIPPHTPHPASDYWNAQKHRRFMIYVHSKLMIVDDLYLLIGSANVNQRSMDGERDTEIAIGCYQSHGKVSQEGDIKAYRLSLWYEHTGKSESSFQEPRTSECVQMIRAIGDEMWEIFSGDKIQDMKGVHLVTYPVHVTQDGTLEDLPDGGGTFPDTKALVKGKRSGILPPIITT
uniref:Phospholipase D n=1 Tax=Kalanchoe fedtschenkoi TaxID=63787 RepID=A0A7N0V0E8_KALFE